MGRSAEGGGCGCLLLILIIGGIAIHDGCENRARTKRVEAARKAEVELQQFEQPLPYSGACRVHKNSYGRSPFQIKSQGGANYLVKLVDPRTGYASCDVFVRGGTTVEVNVPDGTYEVRYACGYTWYGYDKLFGPRTEYSKADREFTFSNGNGYTVTLYKMRNGNLRTSEIDANDF